VRREQLDYFEFNNTTSGRERQPDPLTSSSRLTGS